MIVLRWLGRALLALILFAVIVGFGARFADGPVGPFPGGPLRSGEEATGPVDWASLAEVREVELQLLEPPRSRTTWLVVRDGQGFVPCGLPNTFLKRWPHEVLKDGRVVVRVAGKRHAFQAVRVTDPAEWQALAAVSQAKYGHRPPRGPDDVWFFRLDPRPGP